MYEYGTKNNDDSHSIVDTSKRIVNKSVEEGGPGMGTVLTEWQVLEFNPRNYFSTSNSQGAGNKNWSDDWDTMNFAQNLTDVDAEIKDLTITVPEGKDTISLPKPNKNNIEFKWESTSIAIKFKNEQKEVR